MNSEEKQIMKHLLYNGYSNIVYEPIKNETPDFLIDGKIAIEVRRLNKYVEINKENIALENAQHEVWNVVQKIAKKVTGHEYDHSVFLMLDFKRPLEIKVLKTQIKSVLDENYGKINERRRLSITKNLAIDMVPARNKFENYFIIGGMMDQNEGGFVVGEIYKSLPVIIEEKEQKTSSKRYDYSEWWLALVDRIGHGLDDYDFQQLNALPELQTRFDKILIVSPSDYTNGKFLTIQTIC